MQIQNPCKCGDFPEIDGQKILSCEALKVQHVQKKSWRNEKSYFISVSRQIERFNLLACIMENPSSFPLLSQGFCEGWGERYGQRDEGP